MGQARNRGKFAERREAAIAAGRGKGMGAGNSPVALEAGVLVFGGIVIIGGFLAAVFL